MGVIQMLLAVLDEIEAFVRRFGSLINLSMGLVGLVFLYVIAKAAMMKAGHFDSVLKFVSIMFGVV